MAQTPHLSAPSSPIVALAGIVLIVTVGCAFHFYAPAVQTGANDALDYAAMGRNLARGEGFTTATVYPLQISEELGLVSPEDFDPRKVPNLHRPPLLPLVYSVAYRILGESPFLIPSVSFLSYLALLSLVWCSCLKMDPRNFAQTSPAKGSQAAVVAVVALFPPLVRQIPAGLAEIPAAGVCLAAALLVSRQGVNAAHLFALGLLCGAGFLLKSYLLLLLPAFACFLWITAEGKSRWRFLFVLTAGWLVISGPWLIRNWIISGNPFFTIQAYCEISKGIPGYEAFRVHRGLEPLSTWNFIWNHPSELATKALGSLFVNARSDFGASIMALALGLFVSWKLREAGSETRGLSRVLGLLLLVNVCIAILLASINLEPRYLLPTLLPLFVLSLVGWGGLTIGGSDGRIFISLLVLFTVLNLIGFSRAEKIPDRRADGPFLSSRTQKDGLVLTDADGFVAWFADRPALWLPSDESALEWVLERFPVQAVYLQEGLASPYFIHYSSPEETLGRLRDRFGTFEETPSGGLLLH